MNVATRFALTLLLLSAGCVTGIASREPFPKVKIGGATPELVLGPEVKMTYYAQVPPATYFGDDEVPVIRIVRWVPTLQAAFQNAIGPLEPGPGAPRFELQLAKVEFVETDTNSLGRVTELKAVMHYSAQLVDAEGQVLKQAEGAVSTNETASSLGEIPNLIGSSVEAMYEQAARELLPAS